MATNFVKFSGYIIQVSNNSVSERGHPQNYTKLSNFPRAEVCLLLLQKNFVSKADMLLNNVAGVWVRTYHSVSFPILIYF